MAKLNLMNNGIPVKIIELDDIERVSIGRNPDNDIQLEDDSVSGNHAEVVAKPSQYMEGAVDYWLRDLESTNGISVNGQDQSRYLLEHGDEVAIGIYTFRMIDEEKMGAGPTRLMIPDTA